MTLTLPDIDFLASPVGVQLLAQLVAADLAEANTLTLLTRLRRSYSPQQASAALEMARLRHKAVDKFGAEASQLFFTRDGLEQASDFLIRSYRAHAVCPAAVLDACCGIGSDALAFAAYGGDVLGVDIDPVRIEIARYNAAALGLSARFEVADVRDGLPAADLIFYDPARRDAEGRRIYDVERYQPPLSWVQSWQAARILVKLSPGVDLAQLTPYGGHVEFISVGGDLKEALLWFGADGEGASTATLLLPDAVQHYVAHHWRPEPKSVSVPITAPRRWLCEPDPALLRAGLVQNAAEHFDGTLLDETIAYFTTDTLPVSPWVRSWRILDWMPFQLKRLRAYLRERQVGQVTVKKRGSPLTPETLIPQLKLKGSQARTLVLTRLQGAPVVIICDVQPV